MLPGLPIHLKAYQFKPTSHIYNVCKDNFAQNLTLFSLPPNPAEYHKLSDKAAFLSFSHVNTIRPNWQIRQASYSWGGGGGGGVLFQPRPEPEFVNLLGSPGIDSQPGGPVQQPYLTHRPGYISWRNRFLGFPNIYKFGLCSSNYYCMVKAN
jgi:hypothetical protein